MSIAGITGLSPVKTTLPVIVPAVASSIVAIGRADSSALSDVGWLPHAHTTSVDARSRGRYFRSNCYFAIKRGAALEAGPRMSRGPTYQCLRYGTSRPIVGNPAPRSYFDSSSISSALISA